MSAATTHGPTVYDVEAADAAAWLKRHRRRCKEPPTAIGGAVTWELTPTSLGVVVRVRCNVCGKSTDVTDYGGW